MTGRGYTKRSSTGPAYLTLGQGGIPSGRRACSKVKAVTLDVENRFFTDNKRLYEIYGQSAAKKPEELPQKAPVQPLVVPQAAVIQE